MSPENLRNSTPFIEVNPNLSPDEILSPGAFAMLAEIMLSRQIGISSEAEAPKPEVPPIPDNIELGEN